ncbi:MAG: dienelactone hydrolase family protein [Chloroflexota bacterium]
MSATVVSDRTVAPDRHLATLDVTQDYLVREFVDNYEDGMMGRDDLVERVLRITGSTAAAAGVLLALGVKPVYADPLAAADSTAPQPAATGPRSPFSVPPGDPAITTSEVTVPSGDAAIQGYLVRPHEDGRYAAVLVCHENRGTDAHYQDVARRFAKAGYVALHLDLLSRQGGTDAVPANERGAIFSAPGAAEQWVADFQAAMAYLRAQPTVDGDRIGMTGYCFGGGVTWNMCAREPTLRAAAPYYGVPAFPDELRNTRAAVLGVYGETDQRVNANKDNVEQQLKASGCAYQLNVYPGAGHAFFNDTRPSYVESAATAAWQDTLAWFGQHLRG